MDTHKQTNYLYHYKIKLVTPYGDFITENCSVQMKIKLVTQRIHTVKNNNLIIKD